LDDPEDPERRARFGRLKGKKLRSRQAGLIETLLPRLAIDLTESLIDPAALFGSSVARLEVEIGFGGGEHLAARAAAAPDCGFIGCEPFVNGIMMATGSSSSAGCLTPASTGSIFFIPTRGRSGASASVASSRPRVCARSRVS
jgi:hypothetical protein